VHRVGSAEWIVEAQRLLCDAQEVLGVIGGQYMRKIGPYASQAQKVGQQIAGFLRSADSRPADNGTPSPAQAFEQMRAVTGDALDGVDATADNETERPAWPTIDGVMHCPHGVKVEPYWTCSQCRVDRGISTAVSATVAPHAHDWIPYEDNFRGVWRECSKCGAPEGHFLGKLPEGQTLEQFAAAHVCPKCEQR